MLLTGGEITDSGEEEDYPEQNVRATYAKAKFARNRPIIQGQSVQMPTKVRAGQVISRTHQHLIDLAIGSMVDN
jgi:hypothetical protein